ncbi:MAG TPA: MASE1 domain-containing protein [Thermoanaerobaculia bacterium]|nr:MASE1 domain-containing protein [Thermoanaerobaculia bacterium]
MKAMDIPDRTPRNLASGAVWDLVRGVSLAAAYLLLARAGLGFHAVSQFATLVWAPSGIALASMLLWGFGMWPAVAVAAFAANLWNGAPAAVALAIAAGNTGEAVFATWALRKIPGFRAELDRLPDVLGLALLGGVAAPTISATVGVVSLAAAGIVGPATIDPTWRAWWLGDAIAILIVTPLLLTWRARPPRAGLAARMEFAALVVLLALAGLLIFELRFRATTMVLTPFLIWAALRFEVRGAVWGTFLAAAIAIWATARGHGPFASASVEEGLLHLQTFMGLTSATFLVLGATALERRKAEQALRAEKEHAEEASHAKDRFLATLSHELRTPLTPVLAYSSMLEQDESLPRGVRDRLEIVKRNARLEARLIDDLLDLTRVSSGKLVIRTTSVSVAKALDHAVEVCRDEAATAGVTVVRENAPETAFVRADPARLRQVFWNILENAIKFTPRGGRVVVHDSPAPGGRVAVEISDSGCGIEASEVARIFRPFEQASHGKGGLGLGLAISRALVESQGGSLTAASRGPGEGATFRIELPEGSASDAAAPPPGPPGTAPEPHERRILLVEDHPDSARAAADLLRELSYRVVVAANVAEALEASAVEPFDLVLSDLGLPDGSGLDLMQTLHQRHGLRGIAISGYGMEEDRRASQEAGFVDHLVKPISFERLAAALERFFAEEAAPQVEASAAPAS